MCPLLSPHRCAHDWGSAIPPAPLQHMRRMMQACVDKAGDSQCAPGAWIPGTNQCSKCAADAAFHAAVKGEGEASWWQRGSTLTLAHSLTLTLAHSLRHGVCRPLRAVSKLRPRQVPGGWQVLQVRARLFDDRRW